MRGGNLFDIGWMCLENPASPITPQPSYEQSSVFLVIDFRPGWILFGFDTVVISGAEKTIQSLWGLGAGLHAGDGRRAYGTVLGSLLGGLAHGSFWAAGDVALDWRAVSRVRCGVGLATDVYSFIVARMIGGLGIGISTVAAPLYISKSRRQNIAADSRHVSVQHRIRHPRCLCVQRTACWDW